MVIIVKRKSALQSYEGAVFSLGIRVREAFHHLCHHHGRAAGLHHLIIRKQREAGNFEQ